jgi:hypothetical protein
MDSAAMALGTFFRVIAVAATLRQLLEQSIPVGNVPGVLGLQLPQKQLCRLDVMAASIQRRNHPTLKGDVLFHPLQQCFDPLQLQVQISSVHSVTLTAGIAARAVF